MQACHVNVLALYGCSCGCSTRMTYAWATACRHAVLSCSLFVATAEAVARASACIATTPPLAASVCRVDAASTSPSFALHLCWVCSNDAAHRSVDAELIGIDFRARSKILSAYLSTALLSRQVPGAAALHNLIAGGCDCAGILSLGTSACTCMRFCLCGSPGAATMLAPGLLPLLWCRHYSTCSHGTHTAHTQQTS
jgi:hypothetical protein